MSHFCRIRGIPVLLFCISRYFQYYIRCILVSFRLYSITRGICGVAATAQLCFSQGTRGRISLFCVSVSDASAICDIVTSGRYLTDCDIAGIVGSLGLGWARCGRWPVRRLYGKVGRCQRADVVGDTLGKVSRPSHNLAVVTPLKQRGSGRGDSVGDDTNDIYPLPPLSHRHSTPNPPPRWGEGTFETGAILYRAKVGMDGRSGWSEAFPKKGAARAWALAARLLAWECGLAVGDVLPVVEPLDVEGAHAPLADLGAQRPSSTLLIEGYGNNVVM